MNKIFAHIFLAVLSLNILTACGTETTTLISRTPDLPPVEVQVFDLKKDTPELSFIKSGVASAKSSAYVIPQTSGKVTAVKVKVGDQVQKGEVLITLGDSLSTDIAAIQADTAAQNLDLADESQQLNELSVQQRNELTAYAVNAAKIGYDSAKNAKKTAEKAYDKQKDSAEDGVDQAEKAYDVAKDAYESLLENGGTDARISAAEAAMNSAYTALKSAKSALTQLKDGYKTQVKQLDSAIKLAKIQYDSAQDQADSGETGGELQLVGILMQNLQIASGTRIANLSADQKLIKSPITGVVTSLSVTKDNFISLGTPVATIENPETLSIKTSVNEEEKPFLFVGQTVTVINGTTELEGEIISISPALDLSSKKINVEVELLNNEDILSGTLVKIDFKFTPSKQIFIPLNSVFNSDKGQYVKVVKDSQIKFQTITMGDIIGEYVEILGGLNGHEQIVKNTDNFVQEGEKITVATTNQ